MPVISKTNVSNLDGTITVSNGSIVSIALGNANTWTAVQTILKTGIGAVSTDAVIISNTAGAGAGAQQWSPRLHFVGQGWKTAVTAGSQTCEWIIESQPVQNTTSPNNTLVFSGKTDVGTYVPWLTLATDGNNLTTNTANAYSFWFSSNGTRGLFGGANTTYVVGSAPGTTDGTCALQTAGLKLRGDTATVAWSTSTDWGGGVNTSLSKISAGVVGVGTGAQGSVAGTIQAAIHTSLQPNIAAVSTDGLILSNATAATVGNPQWSPRLRLSGNSWDTSGSASTSTDWIIENKAQNVGAPAHGKFVISYQLAGGGYTAALTLDPRTTNGMQGGMSFGGQIILPSVSKTISFNGGGSNNYIECTSNAGGIVIGQPIVNAGTPTLLTVLGVAHTACIASVEAIDVNLNLSSTLQFATGTLATQRSVVIQARTYSGVGVMTITDAATLSITGAPIQGTNVTITSPWALKVASGKTFLSGDVWTNGNFFVNNGGIIEWNSQTKIAVPVDGTIRFTNNATTGFTAINLGGDTASFPAVRRNATAINFRLADNSADCAVTALSYNGAAITSAGSAVTTFPSVNSTLMGIVANSRSTGQTGAVASVTTYTLPASDGSFFVSANVLVTTASNHNFTVTVTYTDEGSTSRTLTLSFTLVAGGTLVTAVANANGAVPYMGIPQQIRCKASTSITIATTGTFTTVTYNAEGMITKVN